MQRKPGFCIALQVSAAKAVIWSGDRYSEPDQISRHLKVSLQVSEGQNCDQVCNIMGCHVKRDVLEKVRFLYNWLCVVEALLESTAHVCVVQPAWLLLCKLITFLVPLDSAMTQNS